MYYDDGVSGTVPPDLRPGLSAAITALDNDEGNVLMVAKVDRLGRSFSDLALLTPLAEKNGWGIIALNCPLDTTTPNGALMMGLMQLFAQLEQDLISERTTAALAVKKAAGTQLGRPSQVSPEAKMRLAELRASGLVWREVAEIMNAAKIPSGSGIPAWNAASAQRLCPAA
jgi:DNA invertase Pin-like site-specific DNA recombinase